ncbi:hypothetical protein DSECCO2_299180 [anaerobic digester metagenome]
MIWKTVSPEKFLKLTKKHSLYTKQILKRAGKFLRHTPLKQLNLLLKAGGNLANSFW